MEGGKIVADFPNYHHTAEISGGKLVEVSSQVSILLFSTATWTVFVQNVINFIFKNVNML